MKMMILIKCFVIDYDEPSIMHIMI